MVVKKKQSQLSIFAQLLLLFLLTSGVPLVLLWIASYKYAKTALEAQLASNLSSIAQRQANVIENYISRMEGMSAILSSTRRIVAAMTELEAIKKKSGYDSAEFEAAEQKYDPLIDQFVEHFDYDDMLLINRSGDVIYSNSKHPEFPVNLYQKNFKDSELRKAFERSIMHLGPQPSNIDISSPTGNQGVFVACPIFSSKKLIGVLAIQLKSNDITEIVNNFSGLGLTGETVLATLHDKDMVLVSPTRFRPNAALDKIPIGDDIDRSLERAVMGEQGTGFTNDYRDIPVLAAWNFIPSMQWGIVVKKDEKEAFEPILELDIRFRLIAVGTIVMILVLAALTSVYISRPITLLTRATSLIAEGDLTPKVKITRRNEIGQLSDSIKSMVNNLKSLVGQVKTLSYTVTSSATEIAATSKQQTESAHQTGKATSQISTKAKEISSTATSLANTMEEVNTVTQQTALSAESGLDGLSAIKATMDEFTQATNDVSKQLGIIQTKATSIETIITTMTKVADQTNLLSLNAAIEAKKAGKFGLGFSIVAQEIRRLADQTADSTLEIESSVKDMSEAVKAGVKDMEKFSLKVNSSVIEITSISNRLATIIQQVQGLPPRFELVLQGMHSQSSAAGEISQSMQHLSSVAQKTIIALEETNSTLEHLRDTSQKLQSEISRFKT